VDLVVAGKRVRAATGGRALDPDRPLLVLVHGAGMDHTVWTPVARRLAGNGFAVLAPDLPGHGRSQGPAPVSVEDCAGWLGQLVAAVGGGPAHLAGHSMGALAVLHLAATQPSVAGSLTLVATADRMPVHPDLQAAADRHEHLAIDLIVAWSFPRTVDAGPHPAAGLAMRHATVRLLERADPAVIASDLRASAAYEQGLAAATAVRCPALLVLGERDVMIRPSAAAPLAAALAGARTATLAATGHMLVVERPDDVANAMLPFLAAAGQAAAP